MLAQGEVLEGEVAVAAAEEREEAKHVEQEGDHRAGIFSGSEPTDQTFGRGLSFGEGQSQTEPRFSTTRAMEMRVTALKSNALPGRLQLISRQARTRRRVSCPHRILRMFGRKSRTAWTISSNVCAWASCS